MGLEAPPMQDQQPIEEPRAEPSTDPRTDMSRLLEDEDGGSKTDFRLSKGPSLWRYRPAKRAGGWGSLFFTLLGGKQGQDRSQVRVPNNADYYVSTIGKKEKTP